jgi:hypothetical protein
MPTGRHSHSVITTLPTDRQGVSYNQYANRQAQPVSHNKYANRQVRVCTLHFSPKASKVKRKSMYIQMRVAVGIVTGLPESMLTAGRRRGIPFSSAQCHDRLWKPPSLFIRGIKRPDRAAANGLHLILKLQTSGSIPPFYHMCWRGA